MRRWAAIFVVTSLALAAVPMTAGAQEVPLDVTPLESAEGAGALAGLLADDSVTVSNASYVGTPAASGTFSGGAGIIGLDSGILLTSGSATNVIGPNVSDGISTVNGSAGDVDLNTIVGGTSDAAVLEFDFVVAAESVTFNYVFASDEYNEFANSTFNDVFAFFVNGTNCAMVGDQPVSVNTINGGNPFGTDPQHPELFINNDTSDGGPTLNTEMDGLTVVLSCTATVNPAPASNTIKLAIADTGDSNLDSAVFLQAGSFVATPEVDLSIAKVADQETVTTGGEAAFTITVRNENVDGPPATGVTVNDSAFFSDESSLNIVSASGGEAWTCVEGLPPCTLNEELTAGATSPELHIVVQAPDSPGTITNTATVAGDQPDEVTANDTASAETTVEDEVPPGSAVVILDEPNGAPIELVTTGGQTGWDTKMTIPVGSPAGVYRLKELEDPVVGSKGSVEYEAPEGAEVLVQVTCAITQCPKRRLLDLVMIVIKTDEDGTQHILPPCHLVIKVGRRTVTINREAPCVVSVTRAGNTAPLIWTVKLKGGPDPGVRGR